jgi:hypothetical protein
MGMEHDDTTKEKIINRTTPKVLYKTVLVGAFLGVTWAASLRSWMQGLALHFGDRPEMTWNGTFLLILIPAGVMGALLATGDYYREQYGNMKWQWAGLAPLLMMIVPMIATPNFIPTLMETGNGGGAIAVTLFGMLGGHALSGRGPVLSRVLTGLAGGGMSIFFGSAIYSSTIVTFIYYPNRAFGILHFLLLMTLLMWAASLPYRKLEIDND